MTTQKPEIYSYSDFRHYLKDLYTFQKKTDKRYSHRFIATKVRATSSGWFSDVISGRINLTATYISRLISVFKLPVAEADYFRALVDCSQSTNLEDKNRYLELLLENRKSGAKTVTREQFIYYSTWYIPVIRELLFFYDFNGDYRKLARMLRPPIRVAEARGAIDILKELQFIEPDANGNLKPKDAILRKESSFKSLQWANFQKSAMELATEAIDHFNREERDISSVLVSLSPETMRIAKDEVARLRKKLLKLSEADQHRNTV
jgi:uncharacterized protein (TIGR02147 family)